MTALSIAIAAPLLDDHDRRRLASGHVLLSICSHPASTCSVWDIVQQRHLAHPLGAVTRHLLSTVIMANSQPARKRVAVIGAGASGMSAAYALSLHPDMFSVVLFERSGSCGGMATSSPIEMAKFQASYINDGVQGGSPQFHNTFGMFEKLGHHGSEVGFQISFGKHPGKDFCELASRSVQRDGRLTQLGSGSNVFPSDVIDQYQADIKRFGKVLKIISALEPVFALMSVSAMLRLFRFSSGFGDVIVFPLVALFMGTGNQCVILLLVRRCHRLT